MRTIAPREKPAVGDERKAGGWARRGEGTGVFMSVRAEVESNFAAGKTAGKVAGNVAAKTT
jgi:hypothetical protein